MTGWGDGWRGNDAENDRVFGDENDDDSLNWEAVHRASGY